MHVDVVAQASAQQPTTVNHVEGEGKEDESYNSLT